jgi:poly(3-hydroxybutyrate) depolymerase
MGGPLLFYWHGTGGSASEATRMLPSSVRQDITSQGGIIASFNGRDSAGTEGDCSGTGAHNRADFLAADQIAACAVQNHGIDPRRIYSTGCSAGGLQTGCMAAARSEYIAAVAPNSGGGFGRFTGSAPAAFTMHGGTGDNVIINFGDSSRSFGMQVTAAGGFWVECNHMIGHCRAPSDLQVAAWEFLKAHPYGTSPSPYEGGLPASFPSYCEIH